MKILFCANDRPGHFATGPNAWIQRLIPVLRDKYNLDVQTLFIYKGEPQDCPTLTLFQQKKWRPHLINRDDIPYVADQVKEILKLIKKDRFTVLVANLVIPAYYAARYLKPFNIPVIGVMHSNDKFYKGVIAKFIHGNQKNNLTHSVAVSNYIDDICKAKSRQTNLTVIPCGTPVPTIKTDYIEKSTLNVIYAGRLETEQKQILKLTEAFLKASSINPNLYFSIYGEGSMSEEVKSIISQLNVRRNVKFKGPAAPSEMLEIMSKHQVFTLMSDYEGMPVSLMEAMACGLVPVCLEESSGINEIIEHGVNGFIVKNRGEDYQKHLQSLQEDVELWKRLSSNAVKTIESSYSDTKTGRQWYELLVSFQQRQTKRVRIPNRIRLEGDLLYYGDNRKPSFITRLQSDLKEYWMNLRLLIRPRARLRALFKNER
ncbi:MAG: glycosyltransferase family 4 protein [Bacteroidota bacterium]